MNYWNQTPLFRLLPFFISGILFAVYVTLPEVSAVVAGCLIILPGVLFYQFASRKVYSFKRRWLFGLAIYLFFFMAGWLLSGLHNELIRPGHFSKSIPDMYAGVVNDFPVEKEKSIKAELQIYSVRTRTGWKEAEGKILAYIGKDSSSAKLQQGDLIIFSEKPSRVRGPANPGQFNYQKFLGFRQVYHQVLLASNQWQPVGKNHGFFLKQWAASLRLRMMKVFDDNHIVGQDYAVLSALLLGYEGDIDQDIIRAYSASGALHVLSVSGLHVGIIFIALNFLLAFLDKSRKAIMIKAVVIILFLWFYAMLTGLSPSVLRSAAMLSFVVLGSLLERKTNTYNSLAASAFLLLAMDPMIIMQVGFQLSYLAVLGIVFLYPKILHLYYVKSRLLKAAWSLAAVSIAAQLATFPLGLFYFHQFPNYFLISNMLIIPLSTVIIYGGILLLIISPVTALANLVGYLLGGLVHFLNAAVLRIEELPYSLMQEISISGLETCLLYALIMFCIMYLLKKEGKYIIAVFGIAIVIIGARIFEYNKQSGNRQLIVYKVPRHSAIDFVDGIQSVLLTDSSLWKDVNLVSYNIRPNWRESGVEENGFIQRGTNSSFENLCVHHSLVKFFDKIILNADSGFCSDEKALFPKVDFLILSNNTNVRLHELLLKAKPGKVIIDSSNSFYKSDQWTKTADSLGIEIYSVLQNGAFTCSL